jgi:hypothetical protein
MIAVDEDKKNQNIKSHFLELIEKFIKSRPVNVAIKQHLKLKSTYF